jgi:hypothetical protein
MRSASETIWSKFCHILVVRQFETDDYGKDLYRIRWVLHTASTDLTKTKYEVQNSLKSQFHSVYHGVMTFDPIRNQLN